MISKKSPGGANFPYYYKNGGLFGAHYESYTKREQELVVLIRAEEEFILKQNYPLPYWVNFYGTKLTDEVLSEFIQSINRLQSYIPKLAIVGCSVIDKWRLKQVVKKTGTKIPVQYFSDPEDAKTWLVGEHY
jgi:hypothetical protein